jgi:hypothetical protein
MGDDGPAEAVNIVDDIARLSRQRIGAAEVNQASDPPSR